MLTTVLHFRSSLRLKHEALIPAYFVDQFLYSTTKASSNALHEGEGKSVGEVVIYTVKYRASPHSTMSTRPSML